MSPEQAPTDGSIDVAGVTKVFTSDSGQRTVAIDKVSLGLAGGKVGVLIGPSGCGKSTLLNLLSGLDAPTAGSVTLSERPASPRRDVGLMFQQAALLPWRTVLENILLPLDLLGDKVDEAAVARARSLLELVGLADWSSSYPSELSGGMQQRVALARVLLPEPDILLLDEPFGALDEMTRESLDMEMSRIVEESHKTVMMVTHSIYEAVLVADQVFVLSPHPGRLVGIVDVPLGRPRELTMTGTEPFSTTVATLRQMMHQGR